MVNLLKNSRLALFFNFTKSPFIFAFSLKQALAAKDLVLKSLIAYTYL